MEALLEEARGKMASVEVEVVNEVRVLKASHSGRDQEDTAVWS